MSTYNPEKRAWRGRSYKKHGKSQTVRTLRERAIKRSNVQVEKPEDATLRKATR